MRIVLSFPPVASGTYVPLGIAALKAYITRHLPEAECTIYDLNILAWHRLLNIHPGGKELFAFVKNKNNDFYDADKYLWYKTHTWDPCQLLCSQWIEACKIYLEQEILDTELKQLIEYLAGILMATLPQLLGFSVMFPRQLLFTLALSKYIKSYYRENVTIILGGALLSTINCREVLAACAFVDLIMRGEGEQALVQLCNGESYPNIPGLIFRDINRIQVNEKQNTFGIKQLPPADFGSLPLSLYLNPTPVLPAYYSRGCSWRRCRFCVHNYSFSSFRCKTVAQFVDELELYGNLHQAHHFYFTDQYLFESGSEAIAAEIIRRGLDIRFHYMGRPTGGYTDKLCALLYRAGCRWISWGIESGSQHLLDVVAKGTNIKEIRQTLERASRAGISSLGMLIFGLPGSNDVYFRQTLDFLNEITPYLDAVTASEFILFKDTPFARSAKQYNLRITGTEEFCRIKGNAIHSYCLYYQEDSGDGSFQAPRSTWEAARWKEKQQWFFTPRVFHTFNAEHYLLYASHLQRKKPPAGADTFPDIPDKITDVLKFETQMNNDILKIKWFFTLFRRNKRKTSFYFQS